MVFIHKKMTPDEIVGCHFEQAGMQPELSLGKLESCACAFLTVFLAFLHAGITREEATLAEGGFEFGIVSQKRACNSMPQGAGLAGTASAVDVGINIEVAKAICHLKRLFDNHGESFACEVCL
jgi:hypothetical protein